MASTAIEMCAEDRDDFEHILHQIFFKATFLSRIENDDLCTKMLTEGKNQFRAKAQQAILVREHQAFYFSRTNPPDQRTQSAFAVVES